MGRWNDRRSAAASGERWLERREIGREERLLVLPNGPGAQLRAARVPRGYSGGRPALLPPDRSPAGWEASQAPGRRRVSCSALLGGAPLRLDTFRTQRFLPLSLIRLPVHWPKDLLA
jgi:hypothetical protein